MAQVPFPEGAKDGTVFFHDDKVCVYSDILNTWECRNSFCRTLPIQILPDDAIYTTDVYVPDYTPTRWQYLQW